MHSDAAEYNSGYADAMKEVKWNGQPAFWKGVPCHQTPDDLWNYAETVWDERPATVIEVGRGEGGTVMFLRDFGAIVLSVDVGDPVPAVSGAFVILDGDVYSAEVMRADLATYSPLATTLVVCHTNREDWGAVKALRAWMPNHPEWEAFDVRHPTQHTWLKRI